MQKPMDMMIESKIIRQMSEGSYEERMTAIVNAIEETEDFGKVALIATHPSRVIVLDEDGVFYSVGYMINNENHVRLKRPEPMDVSMMAPEEVSRTVVDDFFDGKSLRESVGRMVKQAIRKKKTEFEIVQENLSELLGASVWTEYLDENRSRMTAVAFDASLGSPIIESKPKFMQVYEGQDEGTEGQRDEIIMALSKLESRLSRLYVVVAEGFDEYETIAGGDRDQEADQLLGQFEAFAEDYLMHLGKVGGFISESIGRRAPSCAACAALVYDRIAERVVDLELGGRLIRKISAEFTQQ